MFTQPYETTMGSLIKIEPILKALRYALIEKTLVAHPDVPNLWLLLKNDVQTQDIPPFNHPIEIDGVYVLDLRTYESKIVKRADGGITLPDYGPVGLLVKIVQLQIIWANGASKLKGFSDFPIMLFSNWLSYTISKRLGLDLAIQLEVRIIAAWFYSCQYMDAGTQKTILHDQSTLYSEAHKISRITGSKNMMVLELVQQVGVINTLPKFIEALHALNDRRLGTFNLPLLMTLMGGSWYGSSGAREQVAVALEFPPYFIAMAHSALNERMYKKVALAEAAQRVANPSEAKRMNVNLSAMLNLV